MAFPRALAIGGWQIARRRLDSRVTGGLFDPAPPLGLTGGSGRGAGGGGEDGVPEPPAGVPADPTGQPRLHHRLRPHHRRCGEQLQCPLSLSVLDMIGSSGNWGLGLREAQKAWSRGGGGGQGSPWGSELL